jgi:hypothetical protein
LVLKNNLIRKLGITKLRPITKIYHAPHNSIHQNLGEILKKKKRSNTIGIIKILKIMQVLISSLKRDVIVWFESSKVCSIKKSAITNGK